MKFFNPQDRLEDAEFQNWLSSAVQKFWFSGFDRTAGSAYHEKIRQYLSAGEFCCWGVENFGNLGIAILAPCNWETSIIGRAVAQVLFLGSDDYTTAAALCEEIRQYCVNQQMAFVSADPGVSPAYIICALEQAGFHVASHYYQWVAKTSDLTNKASRLAQKYTFRIATSEDESVVGEIASKEFVDGRYLADPFIPQEYGNQLYAAWAANSCRGYDDVVILYEKNQEIVGFVTGKVEPSRKVARLGLLAVKSTMQNKGIGLALLAKAFLWCAEQGVELIRLGTQKPNIEINRIYLHFGFVIEESGLVLHWTSPEYNC
ncbi:MAG: GNAT family N-acetyltransferase [Oscillatoria sp. Prado101]|nr:GNAT family N-acetyltransferase [Oscillatoria sp. Prado101]